MTSRRGCDTMTYMKKFIATYTHEVDLQTIIERVRADYPTASLDNIVLSSAYQQHSHFGYDLYDSSDYISVIDVYYFTF